MPQPIRQPRSLRRFLWLALLAAVIGLSLWFAQRAVPVSTVTPRRQPLMETLAVSGRVWAERFTLTARCTGDVTTVLADVGDVVDPGTPLLELSGRRRPAEVQRAQAALQQAQQQRRGVSSVDLSTAREALDQARAQRLDAEREVKRIGPLVEKGALPSAELSRAQTLLTLRKSAERAASSALSALTPGGTRLAQARAAVEQAQAALTLAEVDTEECTRVLAPRAATVVRRLVNPGDGLSPGQALLELVASGPIEVLAEIDEQHLAALRIGQTALAAADAYPSAPFEAKLHKIAPTIDAARGTVEVRFSVPQPPAYLRPDMTLSIDVRIREQADALTLPFHAVREVIAAPHVLLAKDGRARRVDVSLGVRDADYVQILKPLTAEAPVIVDTDVIAGQRVRRSRKGEE